MIKYIYEFKYNIFRCAKAKRCFCYKAKKREGETGFHLILPIRYIEVPTKRFIIHETKHKIGCLHILSIKIKEKIPAKSIYCRCQLSEQLHHPIYTKWPCITYRTCIKRKIIYSCLWISFPTPTISRSHETYFRYANPAYLGAVNKCSIETRKPLKFFSYPEDKKKFCFFLNKRVEMRNLMWDIRRFKGNNLVCCFGADGHIFMFLLLIFLHLVYFYF